jgi:hypothetical protein
MLTFRVDFNGIQNDDELTTFLSDIRGGYYTSNLLGDVVQLRDGELSCRATVISLDPARGAVKTKLDWSTWTTRSAERAERTRKLRRVFSAPVGEAPIPVPLQSAISQS